jgi:hypothetical protein
MSLQLCVKVILSYNGIVYVSAVSVQCVCVGRCFAEHPANHSSSSCWVQNMGHLGSRAFDGGISDYDIFDDGYSHSRVLDSCCRFIWG